MTRIRTAFALGIPVASVAVVALALLPAGSAPPACPPDPVAGDVGPATAVALGAGRAAIVEDRIVTLGAEGRRAFLTGAAEDVVLRHVASAPALGTAYVEDRRGSDVLVTVTPTGIERTAGAGELTHPAWSPAGDLAVSVDMAYLEVRSPGGRIDRVPPPEGAAAVFSPVFLGPTRLAAVVSEPVPGATTEGEALNQLYRYDLVPGRWTRLTGFSAGPDRWSAIRTPVLEETGDLLFVRVRGRASGSEEPAYELWRLGPAGPSEVRELDGEAYLAGIHEDRPVWNVPSAEGWRLLAETGSGMRSLGCGAVMVDPRFVFDPDLLPGPASAHDVGHHEEEAPEAPTDADLAILVGDFGSRAEAEEEIARLGEEGLLVVDHPFAPAAVAPGAYAVALPVDGGDEAAELDRFQTDHPEVADRTFLVTLAGSEA